MLLSFHHRCLLLVQTLSCVFFFFKIKSNRAGFVALLSVRPSLGSSHTMSNKALMWTVVCGCACIALLAIRGGDGDDSSPQSSAADDTTSSSSGGDSAFTLLPNDGPDSNLNRQPRSHVVTSGINRGQVIRAEVGPNDFDEWVRKRDGLEPFADAVAVPPPRDLDTVRAGSGAPFRSDLEWSDADRETLVRHKKALESSDPNEYFRLLADTDTPILPWKKHAAPIVCNKKEYFSGHFSIPPQNIVSKIPEKVRDWATVVPGRKETYVFKAESGYRQDLEASRFGITRRRYGFATNRNLEMLAAACVPYFCGIHRVPKVGTLDSLPKSFLEMMLKYPGVSAKCNPPKKAAGFPIRRDAFNETRYQLLSQKLLSYTRAYQSTAHFAKYVLSATSLQTLPRSVLIVWASHYSIMLTGFLNGLRNLGVEVVDVPRRTEIYMGENCATAQALTYAKGWFFYCKTEESPGVSRDDIEIRIRSRAFDLVVVSVTDTLTYHMKNPSKEIPFFDAITSSYPRDLIVTMNDADLVKPMTADVAHSFLHDKTLYFKRETHGCHESIW